MLEDHPKSCLVNVTAVLEISFASFLEESRLYLTEPLLMHFGKCKDILIIFHHFEGKKQHYKGNQKVSLCSTLTYVLFYSHIQLFSKTKRNSKRIINIDRDQRLYCLNAVEEKFAFNKVNS